jgi:DNA-binding transcriptional MerR regulator
MSTGPLKDAAAPMLSLEEAAIRLNLSEAAIREWLATFNWERRYDGAGHLMLAPRDLDFLRVIKSLKDVDRSCESIVRIIQDDAPLAEGEIPLELSVSLIESPEATAAPARPAVDPVEANLAQLETLKAELRELHAAKPARKPFWKFWAR